MSTFVRCVGCGEPLYGHPCQWCTCERCGNDLRDGYCFLCHSRNEDSFTYDSTPNSFDNPPDFSYHPPQPQYETYSCELCGNDAHYGYDCPPQVPFVYNQDPCFNQNFDNDFPQISPNFPQQFPCCENCGGLHETFQCQPINQNFYEPNLCFNSISFDFDQFQPPQFPVIHQPPQEMSIQDMEDLKQQYLDEMKTLINKKDYRNGKIDIEIKINELKGNFNGMSIEINKKKKLHQLEQDDDDDDEEYTIAIIPDLPTEEPDNSLIMEDEQLDTIPATESEEFIKSSAENLVPIPSESEDFFDIESDDDESSHEEIIHEISFKTYSNPLFDLDKEIISSEFNLIHNEDLDSTPKNDRFDTESYLLESLLNRDTLMASSPKIDSIFDEFAGELITIPPRIVNIEHEEYISLLERLLYDNSSPRPPEDFHANPNTIIESLPTFSILVEDSDSLREEIDIFLGPDDSIPPGIESDDYDSEGDENSTSLPEFESFHVDYPDSGDSTIDVVEDIPVDVPNILPTHPTLHMDFDFIPSHNDLGSDLDVSSPSGDRNKIYDPGICIEVESTRFLATHSPVIDTLLLFLSENKDKVFNHGVLASKKKSPHSSSHRGFKALKLFHHKSPMLIYGEDIPILDVLFFHFYPP
ncbi:hypothetical protein Tco_1376019 [Tanacetum coccineum]